MSTSNSKRPAEDPMEGTSKCHKQIASDLESDSDVEPGTIYTTTKINDVFLADKVTAPEQIKQDIADWSDPIIIIVAKTARDDLLTFLKEFRQKSRLIKIRKTTVPTLKRWKISTVLKRNSSKTTTTKR